MSFWRTPNQLKSRFRSEYLFLCPCDWKKLNWSINYSTLFSIKLTIIYTWYSRNIVIFTTPLWCFLYSKKKKLIHKICFPFQCSISFLCVCCTKGEGFQIKKKMEENLYFSRTTMLVLFSIYQIRNPWNKKTSSNFQ